MKISHILYLTWHLGMLLLLCNWHFQDDDFTNNEKIFLPMLFTLIGIGLFLYYSKIYYQRKELSSKLLFSIIIIELIAFILCEVLIFLFGWTFTSAPG